MRKAASARSYSALTLLVALLGIGMMLSSLGTEVSPIDAAAAATQTTGISGTEVWQISASLRPRQSGAATLTGQRLEYLADRMNGRYRLTAFDQAGRVSREVSVFGKQHIEYFPSRGSVAIHVATSSRARALREVDDALWGIQNAVREGKATVVGQRQVGGRPQVVVRLPSQGGGGTTTATFDASTGLNTGVDAFDGLPNGYEVIYERIEQLPASAVSDSRFQIGLPVSPTYLERHEPLNAGSAALPAYGVYWLGQGFGGLEPKTVERLSVVRRRSATWAPTPDRVYAIYGVAGNDDSAEVQVITEAVPDTAELAHGRVLRPDVISTRDGQTRMELVRGNTVVTLYGRSETEVKAMAVALAPFR